jgi:hypothetical protein
MHSYILAFFSELNNKHITIIKKYRHNKLNSIKPFSKYFQLKFKFLLSSLKYFIILNKYNKNSYKILNNIETLCFLYYNNNFYKNSFKNKLNIAITLRLNTKLLLLNNVYRVKFMLNILKYITILKYKNVNTKSIN